MLRFGRHHDRCFGDKIARSNRGRSRTSAGAFTGRKHQNLGYRRSQVQLVEMRADKKHARLEARLSIEDTLFDLELDRYDPEIWLHGTDLTTSKDLATTRAPRGYPISFAADPYTYRPDDYDWAWEITAFQEDDEETHRYLYAGEYDAGDFSFDDVDGQGADLEPEPIDVAWRDLWVAGRIHDPDGRDLPDREHDPWNWDCDYSYDYLDELENPLLTREAPVVPSAIEAIEERAIERHRAGERYFRQTGRTVQSKMGTVRRVA